MLEYAILTLSLILLGDAAFVPAVYLAVTGHLNIYIVMLLSFMVSNCMDMWWYFVGTKGLKKVFKSLPFVERWEKKHPELLAVFMKHRLKIIFWSRFLHGSGTSIMILSGIYKVPFKKYMLMNLLSSLIIVTGIPIILHFAQEGSEAVFENHLRTGEWVLGGIVLIVLVLSQFEVKNWVLRLLLGKKREEGNTGNDGNV